MTFSSLRAGQIDPQIETYVCMHVQTLEAYKRVYQGFRRLIFGPLHTLIKHLARLKRISTKPQKPRVSYLYNSCISIVINFGQSFFFYSCLFWNNLLQVQMPWSESTVGGFKHALGYNRQQKSLHAVKQFIKIPEQNYCIAEVNKKSLSR